MSDQTGQADRVMLIFFIVHEDYCLASPSKKVVAIIEKNSQETERHRHNNDIHSCQKG